MTIKRSPNLYWILVAPTVAVAAMLARWRLQGSGNLYTEPTKRLYVPDPDLDWRLSTDTYLWLGLDSLAVVVGFAGALIVASWLLRRRERKRDIHMKKSRVVLVVGSAVALILPLLAFASGSRPEHARERAPDNVIAAGEGIEASLPAAPAGSYLVTKHEGTRVAASLRAGGDIFEARFAGKPRGSWRGDPTDLAQPMTAEIYFDAKSVDTANPLRNDHTGEYLKVEEFPEIGFKLTRMSATTKTGEGKVAFSGTGNVLLMGREIATDVTGTVTELDDAGKARLSLGASEALVVNASMKIGIDQTPIENDGSFDSNEVPIRISLVLIYEGAT